MERGVRATGRRILEIGRSELSRSDQQQFQKDTAQLFPLLSVPEDSVPLLQRRRVRRQGRVHIADRPRVYRSQPQQDRVSGRVDVQGEPEAEIDRSQQQSHTLHPRRVLQAAGTEGAVPGGEQHSRDTGRDVRWEHEFVGGVPPAERDKEDRRARTGNAEPTDAAAPERELHRESATRLSRALRQSLDPVPRREQHSRAGGGNFRESQVVKRAATPGQSNYRGEAWRVRASAVAVGAASTE